MSFRRCTNLGPCKHSSCQHFLKRHPADGGIHCESAGCDNFMHWHVGACARKNGGSVIGGWDGVTYTGLEDEFRDTPAHTFFPEFMFSPPSPPPSRSLLRGARRNMRVTKKTMIGAGVFIAAIGLLGFVVMMTAKKMVCSVVCMNTYPLRDLAVLPGVVAVIGIVLAIVGCVKKDRTQGSNEDVENYITNSDIPLVTSSQYPQPLQQQQQQLSQQQVSFATNPNAYGDTQVPQMYTAPAPFAQQPPQPMVYYHPQNSQQPMPNL